MSSVGAQGGAVPSGSGGPGGAVNFGDLDVIFSAPFYTGVFLSSRELQGNYECHQNIVIEGMEEKLRWGWSSPLDISEFWHRKVSPPYFIGTEKSNQSSPVIRKVKCYVYLSGFRYGFRYDSLELKVKFFEPGFGLVSVRLSGLVPYQGAVFSAKNFSRFLADREERIRQALDSIAQEVTRAYRSSVPCCIKNSDIWDINNFGGLEATEGICSIGSVQEINTVVAMQHSDEKNFINLTSELKKVFVEFSKKLRKPPFNGTYNLFSTKEQNTTMAVSMIQNHDELGDIIDVSEVLGVQLAVGRYFDNFFYSYYNYTSSQYEIVESKEHILWKNLWGFKNLIEKFFDVQSMYFQTKDLVSKDILIPNCDKQISKLYSVFPKNTTIDNYFCKADQKINKIEKQYDKIKFIASKYLTFSVGFFAVVISSIFLSIPIALRISDNLLAAFAIAIIIFLLACLLIFGFVSLRLISRKLYYLCDPQKKDLREQYKEQEKRNESKGSCICEVKKCHRCRDSKWHSRIFYRDENLCFRCGKKER